MTINEKKQLTNYIKGLVRESLNEMPLPDGFFQGAEDLPDDLEGPEEDEMDDEGRNAHNDFWKEMGHENGRHYEGPDVTTTDNDSFGSPEYEDEEKSEDDEPAGINELRQLAESMARQALTEILSESKKKKGKRKNKKEKTSSKDKTVVSKLNSDGTNAAHYFYKLYGVENGTETEKAAARSKGYKKAKGKKNDTGVPYKFTSKERNRLNSLLTDR